MLVNQLRHQHQRLASAFFQVGWLLPVAFPVFELLGRGVFNSLTALYGAWGLLAMPGRWQRIDRKLFWLYLLPVAAFGLSLLGAVDLNRGLQTWIKFFFVTLTLFFTVAALSERAENEERLFHWLGIAAAATVLVLVVQSLILSGFTQLVAPHQLRERNLPFLLPFAILWLGRFDPPGKRRMLIGAALLLVSVIVVLSAGRSALIGLIAACCVLGLLRFRLHPGVLVGFCLLLVTLGVLLSGSWFFRHASLGQSPADVLDTVSSGRTVLWRQALAQPPQNLLTGVGMGNVRFYEEVLTIGEAKVRHLHNFILDCWYETGFFGLLALLGCYGGIGWRALRTWPHLAPPQRDRIATLAAAAVAILAAGMLSFSYYSPQFTNYLFVLLAGLWHLGKQRI